MKFFKYIALGSLALSLGCGVSSCVNDLDVEPDDPNKKTELTTAEEWYGYFSSLYGNLLYEGGLTPNGVDGGAGTWMRCHWNLQEITADEAIIIAKWNDPGYNDLKFNTWMTDNTWMFMAYQREATSAKLCSEFLSKVDGAAGVVDATLIEQMKAEARVLRAYCYYYMIDLYGKGPWVTNQAVGENAPVLERTDLFNAVTAELEDVIANGALVVSTQQVYPRLSKEAAHMLAAKLYLNAEVYTGTPMYDKCAAHIKEILKTTNKLADEYKYLFCADNDQYVGKGQEIIWGIAQDANNMTTYGGTTYLTAGAFFTSAGDEILNKIGTLGQTPWEGLKVRPELINVFSKTETYGNKNSDKRYLFYEGSYNNSVENLNSYDETSDGYMCIKYTYTTSSDYENTANKTLSTQIADADYPLFRLADAYLMLTECQLNGVTDADPSFEYFNKVRTRAGLGALSKTEINENTLLDERQRELYWEGHRRSDLVRFGKYAGGNYNWSWKGGVYEGRAIDTYRNVFAIPYQYVSTVGQNPGY